MDKTCQQNEKLEIFSAGSIILIGVLISLFNHWEPSGETWLYWFFARILAETGRFIIPDRSPLYALYLNLFRWLGYPGSLTAEYIVTSCIVIFSLTALFRRYLGLGLAVFAALLWLPFLQTSEPPVQKLALACSCLALIARDTNRNRFYFVLSYALFGLAYLFRNIYILMIIAFAVWDVSSLIKHKGIRPFILALRPRLNYWPLVIIIALFAFFSLRQSSHPWNNIYCTSTKWFPSEGKALLGLVQSMNWGGIQIRYGGFEGKDFYFTNQEFFGGANTSLGLIRANPELVARVLLKNIKYLLPDTISAVSPSNMFKNYLALPLEGYFAKSLRWSWVILIFVVIMNGAFRAAKDKSMVLFILVSVALICTSILCLPKTRYNVPFIPVLILSACWYGVKLRSKMLKWSESFSSKVIKRWLLFLGFLCLPVALMVFSNGVSNWLRLTTGLTGDLIRGETKVLETRPYSIKSSFKEINRRLQDCRGIMALESTFIGAFTNIPLDKIYDVWEIPPFGQLGNSVYDGMTTERLNCLLISHELKTGIGAATNYQIRYQNYIRPYSEKLRDLGADTYQLGKFGEMVVLK